MNEQLQNPEPVSSAPQEKKEYQAPEVREYGTLRDLTEFGPPASDTDYTYGSGYATSPP